MAGPTGSGNDARKRRAARIELAQGEYDAALLALKVEAVHDAADLSRHTWDDTPLKKAVRAFADAARDLDRAYGMVNPRRRTKGEET